MQDFLFDTSTIKTADRSGSHPPRVQDQEDQPQRS